MKYFAPLLTIFALLTGPNGYVMHVAKLQVIAVFRAIDGECPAMDISHAESRSIVAMANGYRLCVAEDPDKASAEIEKP